MQLSVNGQHPAGVRVGWLGLVLFSLPFIGFGLFAVAAGLEKWSSGDAGEGAFMVLFGALFAGVGVGIIALARRGRRAAQELEARVARHPEEPWLWNEAWSGGRVRSSARAKMVLTWTFTFFWNAVSIPACFIVPGEIFDKGNHLAAIGLLFPLVGAGLLVWAIRATLRWHRFGESTFEMTRFPGVLGGEVAGVLHAREAFGGGDICARLSCIHRYVTGSGKNRSTHEDVLWSDEKLLPGVMLQRGPAGHALNICFQVPYDLQASDPVPSDDSILWRVAVAASLPGIDYAAQFDIPVFETAESLRERTAEALSRQSLEDVDLSTGVSASNIRVDANPRGGIEIYFPAGRHKAAALGVTIFALAFGGATFAIYAHGAPLPFTGVFGVVSALLLYAALTLWAESTRILARADGVEVHHRLLGMGRVRFIPADSIAGVALDVGMRSGRAIYWDLYLRQKGAPLGSRSSRRGRRVGGRIRDKREAERVAEQVRRALGL